ncbi:DUF444 family protein [Sulfobacillus harzensis]|uniref:DUF444 family protein n=1 Tax=Sulfobacillus harzensis TaxID=2729629 RepID=A0A7Y0Q5R1_9FIRM|nr:DUF444 family protein [Sulfobacillus harzensis]NMP24574.1 DUF444 family protein [Sulfobacillus harzensis]
MTKPNTYSVARSLLQDQPLFSAERRRHQAKVKEAIRQHLADMVTDEKILVSDGRRTLSVPVPELNEFRIRFDPETQETVGQAASEGRGAKPGQSGGTEAKGGKEGGSQPGLDIEETEVSMEEIQSAVFSELELPDLDLTKPAPGAGRDFRPVSVGRHGLKSQWDRRRTLKAALLRHAQNPSSPSGLSEEDLRFRVFDPVNDDQGGAVVIAMMDTSGSMGSFEKYLAKSFFYWTTEFLRQKYPQVELVFLAHDVRAREVDEETFFHRGASGGTVSSSVYRLALEIVENRYPLDRYNIYAFHFTDGGNLTSDNALAVETGTALTRRVTLFGYGEIHDTERNPSPLFQEFHQVPGMGVVILRDKEDIFRAMTHFFGRTEVARDA